MLQMLMGAPLLQANKTCVQDSGNPGVSGRGCAAPSATPFRSPPLVTKGGDFNLILRAPGQGNDGTVTVRANAPQWLRYDWDAANAGDEDPAGIATFGVFQGSARRIDQRECF
jgi:MSHA biogenesis protein MshQ